MGSNQIPLGTDGNECRGLSETHDPCPKKDILYMARKHWSIDQPFISMVYCFKHALGVNIAEILLP
jgi:hypothetical protein